MSIDLNTDAQTAKSPRLRPAVVALAMLCVVLVAFLTPYIEIVLSGTQIGSFAPPGAALLLLFALCGLVDPILRWVSRRRQGMRLHRQELLAVYAVLLACAALPSCQFAGWVLTVTTGSFYYSTPVNHWESQWEHIPDWWGPRYPDDEGAIRQFYEGLRPGRRVDWRTWAKPLLAFGPMVLALYGSFMAVSVLLGPQWIEREKLSFPLVQLPLELTDRRGDERAAWAPFFRDRVMWLGAALPILCHTLNGLHRFFPALPQIQLRGINIGAALIDKPLVAAQPVRIDVYFCLIGFAFLCSRDVPVSIWVFWLVSKLEAVFGCAMGWNPGVPGRGLRDATFPVFVAQQVGSTLTFCAMMLWAARGHLCAVWRRANSEEGSGHERICLWALAAGFVALVAWTSAGGMPVWMGAALWLLTLIFALFVHRMMAEGGVNLLWAAQSGPNYLIYALDGGRFLGPRVWMQLVSLPYFIWHFKGAVGPQSFEGLKLADAAGIPKRSLLLTMAAGMILAAVVGYFSTVGLVHHHGGGVALDAYRFQHVGQRPMQEFLAVTADPQGLQWEKLAGFFASAFVTWGLSWMRWQFVWWRLHPIGYVLSTVFVVWYLWFSVLLGSLANWAIHRYGGVRGYRSCRPLFLGLIFGDFLMLGIWTAITAVGGVRGFQLFVT